MRIGAASMLRELPGTFWALFAGVFVMALATFVFPFLALFLQSRGYSPEQTGLLVALFGAGSIPAGPVAGWLADHVGRRPTLLGSLLAAAVFTALLPSLATPALVVGGTLVLGIAIHAYFPAANAVVADVVRPERYGDAFGLMYWERNAGIAISFAAGGALARYGYDRLFLADAATTLACAAVIWWKVPETRPAKALEVNGRPEAAGPGQGYAAVLADVHFRNLLILNVAVLVGLFQFMVALPLVMARQGFSPSDYGWAMAVNGALIMILSPFVGRLVAAFDAGRILAVGALLVAAGYASYSLCTSALHFAAATAVWTLGEIITMPVFSSLVAKLSPSDQRGRYQGAFSLSFGLALALAPAIGGAVVQRASAGVLWAGVTILGVLVALGHLAAGRARRRAGVGT